MCKYRWCWTGFCCTHWLWITRYQYFSNCVIKHATCAIASQNLCFAYKLEHPEKMAFPWLFASGINGFLHKRNYVIRPTQYFHHCLYYNDGRFRKDMLPSTSGKLLWTTSTYIFCIYPHENKKIFKKSCICTCHCTRCFKYWLQSRIARKFIYVY